jgi:hypothetical protein
MKWVEAEVITKVTSATIKNISGKTLSIITEYHNRSQLTMPSIFKVTYSTISATKSERRLPSHPYTIRNQMEQ